MFELTRQGAVHIIRGDDPIDGDAIESLERLSTETITGGLPQLVLDLEDVPLLDSRGLNWLLDTHDCCLARGGHLRLAAPSTLCREILDVTGLSDELDIFTDRSSAIGSFAH